MKPDCWCESCGEHFTMAAWDSLLHDKELFEKRWCDAEDKLRAANLQVRELKETEAQLRSDIVNVFARDIESAHRQVGELEHALAVVLTDCVTVTEAQEVARKALNDPEIDCGAHTFALCGWCAGGHDAPLDCPKCHGVGGKYIEKPSTETPIGDGLCPVMVLGLRCTMKNLHDGDHAGPRIEKPEGECKHGGELCPSCGKYKNTHCPGCGRVRELLTMCGGCAEKRVQEPPKVCAHCGREKSDVLPSCHDCFMTT